MPFQDLRGQAQRRTPDELIRHLKSFELDLKFSAGVWFFSAFQQRWHERYSDGIELNQRLDIATRLQAYGLQGMEAHYPNEINEDNLDVWKAWARDTGMRVLTVIPLLFYDARYEFGSLSNPDPQVRQHAIERTKNALRLNKELDTDFAVMWPGIDGYENSFGADLRAARDRFARGAAEAMDAVPGVRVAFEPKPYEPRGHLLHGFTSEGILLGQKVEGMLAHPENRRLLNEGHALFAMNPEAGHMLMGYEDLAYAYGLVMEHGRLAHTHLNSQPLGNYDQDLNVGVVAPEGMEATLFALKMYGYRGWFGIDIHPERMPVETALQINMDALRAMNDRINSLDFESIVYATEHPAKARGWLEAYMVRARAMHPEKLAPLAKLTM